MEHYHSSLSLRNRRIDHRNLKKLLKTLWSSHWLQSICSCHLKFFLLEFFNLRPVNQYIFCCSFVIKIVVKILCVHFGHFSYREEYHLFGCHKGLKNSTSHFLPICFYNEVSKFDHHLVSIGLKISQNELPNLLLVFVAILLFVCIQNSDVPQ